MDEPSRTIIIKLNPKYIKRGGIPISILSTTLHNIQQAAYHIGNALIKRDPSTAGRYSQVLKRELELFFVKATRGSLTASLELPGKAVSLFPEFPDFGEKVSEDMDTVIRGIKEDNAALIHQTIPDGEYRRKVLGEIIPIIPPQDADYEIAFRFGQHRFIRSISRPSEEQLGEYIGHISKATKEKPREEVISAHCLARLKKDGSIDKIEEIFDFELFDEVDLRPYRTLQVQWQNRIFELNKEIACDVRKEKSLIVVIYEPLNIRVYNYSRESAINDFSEVFATIWDNYAKEDSRNLTKDAIAIKEALISLVKITTKL